jgi:hypothetical protein
MRRGFAVLLGVALLACAPRTEPADSAAFAMRNGEVELTGVVQIVGSAPINVQVVLRTEEGRSVRLAGPLLDELRRLAGVEIRVVGELATAPDPLVEREIAVRSYGIVAVNGRPVVFGEIMEVAAGRARLRTTDGREIQLTGIPTDFRVGQKVWVQGPESVAVQSYGTVRP